MLYGCPLKEQLQIGTHSVMLQVCRKSVVHKTLTYNVQEVGEAVVANDQSISTLAIHSNSTQPQKCLPEYLYWQSILTATSCTQFCCCFSPTEHFLPKLLAHLFFLVACANRFCFIFLFISMQCFERTLSRAKIISDASLSCL